MLRRERQDADRVVDREEGEIKRDTSGEDKLLGALGAK